MELALEKKDTWPYWEAVGSIGLLYWMNSKGKNRQLTPPHRFNTHWAKNKLKRFRRLKYHSFNLMKSQIKNEKLILRT
jgi:hypothetical protein